MSEFHSEISTLSPAPLWQFFDKICSIPHPSKHEEALAQYIINWATEQGFDVRRDPTGNVFIKKPATPGMENKKLQCFPCYLVYCQNYLFSIA